MDAGSLSKETSPENVFQPRRSSAKPSGNLVKSMDPVSILRRRDNFVIATGSLLRSTDPLSLCIKHVPREFYPRAP